jgi:hypothetical protein
MERICKCGGHLSFWVTKKENEEVFKDLYQCIDCGKDYMLKDGKYKFISKAEFRRITRSRKDEIENNKKEN